MKISKEQAALNRRKIVDVASALFRERGVDGVSVADVMEAAGFTHGGFYNHFADKDALAREACVVTFERSLLALERAATDGLAGYVDGYLSSSHCDDPGHGCPLTSLAIEAARHDALQAAYADGLASTVALMTEALLASYDGDRRRARTQALRMVSEMVGALTLARAVRAAQPRLSSEILRASREPLREAAK